MPMPVVHSKRGHGRSGTVHMVRFVVDQVIESYCGATRQDIYGYSFDIDRVTCIVCRYKAEEKEVHSGD